MLKGIIASVTMLVVLCEAVAAEGDFTEEQLAKQFWAEQFQGWDGIVFVCEMQNKDSFTTQICDTAEGDAHFLASTAGIPYLDCRDCDAFQRELKTHAEGFKVPLLLTLRVLSTAEPPVGSAVILWAGGYYYNAVAQGAVSGPRSAPKSGDFSIWESYLSFSFGDPSDTHEISGAIEGWLKQFYSQFLDARRP